MKTRFVILGMLIAMPPTAQCQRLTLGANFGGASANPRMGSTDWKSGWSADANLGWRLTPKLGLRADANFAQNDLAGSTGIPGEARFNKFDLKVHGMQAQIDYFCANYPQRKGIHTYYVAGDDHEGWYCKDVGVDIGTLAEVTARDKFGRDDLHYLGYMESYIALRHRKTGRASQLMVVHPGGGSSYAISYAPQKFAEALQGGEKPAVILFGHWHKMDVFNYRNVWLIQCGTTEDQTPFMRKQKLEAHVGGLIVRLKQDKHGAIMECTTTQRRYFDRAYHNGSFSMSGPISHPPLKRKSP